jgi:hypothetical protein
MPFVPVEGGELQYEEYGDGPHVVISAQWAFPDGAYQLLLGRSQPAAYRVFLITLRGYARSMPETPDPGEAWYDTACAAPASTSGSIRRPTACRG